jgi:hypothetical protein
MIAGSPRPLVLVLVLVLVRAGGKPSFCFQRRKRKRRARAGCALSCLDMIRVKASEALPTVFTERTGEYHGEKTMDDTGPSRSATES